ncbi:MAG: 2-nitropropane dioxygenase, partial [Bacteroidota bacterium]
KLDRKMDFQIWCGPAMGAFNNWVKDTYLENYENRQAVDVAENIMTGAAYLYRVQALTMQGVELPLHWMQVVPTVTQLSELC